MEHLSGRLKKKMQKVQKVRIAGHFFSFNNVYKSVVLKVINFLPQNRSSDWSILKGFADDKINLTQSLKFFCKGKKTSWLPAFSPFPHNVFKGTYLH